MLPCSPYITPVAFFLWGCIKDIIYKIKVWRHQQLERKKTTDAIATIVDAVLQQTWMEI